MFSRKTRSHIVELMETVREGVMCLNIEKEASMLDEFIAALSVSENICKTELSPVKFEQYKDTMNTVKMAMLQLQENSETKEIAVLSLQIMDWLIEQLKSEPVKKEIVFLPYKASMWDSLESIWKAAYEDKEHCNTYVIPIPYADLEFDEKGQLSLHEWHCERNEIPKYVPTVDYEDINLEEMHPDIIFIHNPYDNTNYVTSVDMRYYSSELKKYTDKLVYVPYFVVGNSFDPAFAKKPGVVNADCVIVQDERVKKLYEENYPGGNPPKGKFLPLGSPKFDKVLFGKCNDYTLPKAWQKIIHGKKVVLYNTSVGTALRYTGKICDKLRFVFQSFKGRDDAALWWRPHPLMESTLRSMRPEVLAEYEKLKKQYVKEGWGIYDDSADLDRAIFCSDIYYGDQSSVVEVYRVTGKPVLYQEMEYTEPVEPFDVPVWTQAMCSDGESLWFVEGKINILMRYHIKSHRLTCEGVLPGEAVMQDQAFNAIAYADSKVFILPSMAKHIHVYDTKTKTFYKIDFPQSEKYKGVPKFYGAFVYQDMLYCIPIYYEYFLRIHMPTLKIEVIARVDGLCHKMGIPQGSMFSSAAWYDKNTIAMLVYQTNKIVIWNLEGNSFSMIDYIKTERVYGTMAMTSKFIYLAGRKAEQFPSDDYVEIYNKDTGGMEQKLELDFFAVRTLAEEQVIVFNSENGHWAVLGEKGHSLSNEGGLLPRLSGALQFSYHSFICCNGNQGIYGLSCHDNTFYIFDEIGNIKEEIRLSLKDAEKLPILPVLTKSENVYEMPGLLEIMLSNTQVRKTERCGEVSSGERIYTTVCGYMQK